IDKKAIEGLASRVSILAEGDFRHLFQEEEGNTIALHQVLEEREWLFLRWIVCDIRKALDNFKKVCKGYRQHFGKKPR
ncbi:hypothetical protein, partial [Bacillus thuringiensis]|uniref:hypothetical protein n=1 Tax=Bacillus thuringiensis TaxID=1428 RepID=UPI002DBC07FD